MPPRSRRLHFPDHAVTTVLVSHDGSAWLSECTAALAAQTRPPQRVVAVDTGSVDDSVELLTEALGASAVVARPRDTALGAAIQAGLDAFAGAPAPPGVNAAAHEWVWVLHDDCAPEPDALSHLLACAESAPSAAVVGPKVVSWDRHHLLEVGVTVDSSGFRETGLEPREVDQGQHDGVADVLAVSTAGMLVRREVWDCLGGLDPRWPLAGDDVDFGWRVNRSGGRVLVAARAVVRHVAAISDGERSTDALSMPVGAAARANGMQVVLSNTSRWLVLPLALRYLLEAVLRFLGALVLLRAPRRARDEVVGIALLVARPDVVAGARRRRRPLRKRPHHEIRGLLAPAGWRWRHAGDAFAAVFAGREAVDQRQRRRAPVETGPVAAEAESFGGEDLGVIARLLSRPGVLLLAGLTALALVADRGVLGTQLHGGRLLPPTSGAADLWSLYAAGWHPIQLGSTTAAPPVIAVLAMLSTLLLGKVWLAVDVLMLGAIPLAGLSAYLSAGAVTRRAWLRVVAAVAYAVNPALLAAVAGGRIDAVIAIMVAPVVVRAAAAAMRRPALHRAVGAGLLLSVATAAAPALWPLALVVLLAGVVLSVRRPGALSRLAAAATTLVVPALLLLPWTWHVVTTPRLLVAGSGLPDELASRHGLSAADLLLLRPGGGAQPPVWVWAPIVVAAVIGQRSSRVAARVGMLLLAAGLTGALLVSRLAPVGVVPYARYWTGPLLAVAALGALVAAVVAADEGPAALRQRAFGWRHGLAALVAVAAVAGLVVSAGGWLVRGSDRPLTAATRSVLPVFAQAEAAAPTAPRILVLRSSGGAVHYALLRGPDGPRLGEADVAPRHTPVAARRALATAVADAAAGRARAFDELASLGISLVVVPTDSAGALARLAEVDGLARVPATSTVVYRLSRPTGELVVLSGADAEAAASGRPLPARAQPRPLPATPGRARGTLPPQAVGQRLLVLAEPRNASWRATLDGHRLPATTAYGWAQAWPVPASGGRLVVSRVEDHRRALVIGAGVLALVALLLCLPTPGQQSRGQNPRGQSPRGNVAMSGSRSWPVFGVLVLVAVAVVGSLVTTTGRVAGAVRGGVAPVTATTLVCPNVTGGPGGLATDMTVARVTAGPAPQVSYSGVGIKNQSAQRLVPRPSAVVRKTTAYGPVAVTATGRGSEGLVAAQTALIPGGRGRALLGTTCQPPGTDWWIVGADGRVGFSDYLFLINPSDDAANVALSFWSARGPLDPPNTRGIPLAPHSFVARPMSAFAPDVAGLAVHVHANSGTVAAAILDLQSSGTSPMGGDWIPPTSAPSRAAVVTGFIPGARQDVVELANPGDRDVTVSLRVMASTKNFVPAGHQTVVVPAGRTAAVDLAGAIAGEVAAVATSSDGPVAVAGYTAQVPFHGFRELAWLAAQPPLRAPAGIAGNSPPFGQNLNLILTAPGAAAKVRVTAGSGASSVVSVPGGRTVILDLRAVLHAGPSGPGPLLLTPLDAPVYALRILYANGTHGPLVSGSVPMVLPAATELPPVVADPRAALP